MKDTLQGQRPKTADAATWQDILDKITKIRDLAERGLNEAQDGRNTPALTLLQGGAR